MCSMLLHIRLRFVLCFCVILCEFLFASVTCLREVLPQLASALHLFDPFAGAIEEPVIQHTWITEKVTLGHLKLLLFGNMENITGIGSNLYFGGNII